MTIDSETLPPLSSKEEELDGENPWVKSKLILSAKFSELHKVTNSHLRSVMVCLTADELWVLKRCSEKPARFSLVRKHRLKDVEIALHCSLANAMSVGVPHTLLRYVYQLENGGSIKVWLSNVAKCRENLDADSSKELPKTNECHTSAEKKSRKSHVNGLLPRSVSVDVAHTRPSSLVVHRHTKSEDRNKLRAPTPELLCPPQPRNLLADFVREGKSLQDQSQEQEHSLQPPDLRRVASDRAIRRRQVLRAKDYPSYLKEKREGASLGNSASTTDLEILQKRGITVNPETLLGSQEVEGEFLELTTSISPPSSPSPSEFSLDSRFHHTQIRRGRMKVSPRISRSVSTDTTPTSTPTALLERGSQTRLSLNDSSLHNNAATLPRSRKSLRLHDAGRGSISAHSSPKLGKSPKLLKIFHRRVHSSSAIKFQLVLEEKDTEGSPHVPGSDKNQLRVERKLHHLSPRELAEELTLMDAELLRKIQPKELEDGAWMDKDKDELAPNVMSMVQSFNRLALLVPTEILEEKTPQARSKVITSFIQIASKCYRFRNYNSLKAILAGLQCTPIYRLKKTWKEVPSKRRKRFNQLTQLMSEDDNWKLYREDLDRCLSANTPCVPFLGLFLTQVVQQESYHKLRAEKFVGESRRGKRRSRSFEEFDICDFNQDDQSKDLALSVSAPTSPVGSDGDDSFSNDQFEGNGEAFVISNLSTSHEEKTPLLRIQQNGLATSESSLDSKCSMDDYLKHKRRLDLQVLQAGSSEVNPKSAHEESTVSFDTVDLGHVLPPEPSTLISVKQSSFDDVDNLADDATEDSGLHSLSHRSSSLPKSSSQSSLDASLSMTDLNQVNFTLKKSRSMEAIIAACTEQDQLNTTFQKTLTELTAVSASLRSLDSVFSNDDESLLTTDLYVQSETGLSHHPNDTCPINTSGYETCPLSSSAQSCQFVHEFRNVRQKLYTDPNCTENPSDDLCTTSEVTCDSESFTRVKKTHTYFRVRRSKSYGHAASKKILHHRKSTITMATDSARHKPPPDPAELLQMYQRVSHGCLNVDSKTTYRALLADSTHNTEGQNYKLSYEREPA